MVSKALGEIEGGHDELLEGVDLAAATEEKETHSFEIDPAQVAFCHRCILYYLLVVVCFVQVLQAS